jgi:hypothetical protein
MKELEKIIKDKTAWKSIKTAVEEKKRINKIFIVAFEEKEDLINNTNWLLIKDELKYL